MPASAATIERWEVPLFPSGEQFEIVLGEQRAVVTELGAGLRSYSVGGADVIDGFGAGETCTSGRGQQLIPWPNRIGDGSYVFDGEQQQLPLNEPQRRNAIHGLVRDARWSVAAREPERVVMQYTLQPQDGYPFSLAVSTEYRLTPDGLSVGVTATNRGQKRCPYGAGAHPYLTVGTPTVDTVMLRAPAHTVLHADDRGIPTSAEPVEGTTYDFRQPRAIGATKLDHALTDFERDAEGIATVRLAAPQGERAVELWMDATYTHLMLFTGDPLPDVARRSLAVEPMTCPPNAFRSGEGIIVLEPGCSAVSTWGISPQPHGSSPVNGKGRDDHGR